MLKPTEFESEIDLAHAIQDIYDNPQPILNINTVVSGKKDTEFLVNPIYFGWRKAKRIVSYVLLFVAKLKHKRHEKEKLDCKLCSLNSNLSAIFEDQAERYFFRRETHLIQKQYTETKLKAFRMDDGILWADGRLDEANAITIQDVEFDCFFDNLEISSSTRVVRPKSELFFSYLVYLHTHIVPHVGNLRTERELLKKIFPFGRYRHMISNIRSDCSACRLLSNKTTQVRMQTQPPQKTMIVPPFYNVQCDIVFGFNGRPFQNSRVKIKLYALILVCINTSATSIWCLESITTQEVINALLRHSSRFGLPANIFVDAGSQLGALKSAQFSVRDVDTYLWDAKGVRIFVTRPKSHSDNGKVECRVKLLRELLRKESFKAVPSLTQLNWETIFSVIANDMNNIPIARSDSSNASSRKFEILTPNRLLLGRNNYRSLHIDVQLTDNNLPSRILENNSKIFKAYMQTLIDHLHFFTAKKPGKWDYSDDRQPTEGDLVSFIFLDGINPTWRLGRVVKISGTRVTIDYKNVSKNSDASSMYVERSPRDVKIIFSENELAFNSIEYFNNLLLSIDQFQGDHQEHSGRQCGEAPQTDESRTHEPAQSLAC